MDGRVSLIGHATASPYMTTASAFVGACLVSFLGQARSNTPKQHENQKNNQDNTDETNPAMSVAVTVTAEAATETAKQKNDEDDDEDESQRHGAIPLLCANLKRDVAEVCTLLLTSRYVDRIAGSALGARQDPQILFLICG